jgi:hypothetical protein
LVLSSGDQEERVGEAGAATQSGAGTQQRARCWALRLSRGLGVMAVRGQCLSLDSPLVQPVNVCRDSIRVREEGRTIDPRTTQRQLDC